MDFSNLNVSSSGSASTTALGGSASTAPSGEDRFLKLLVAQMKNQDPLNPLDNAQVTTQMAQISTVTGIGNLTETVAQLLQQFNGLQALQAAQLTGRDVLIEGNRIELVADAQSRGAIDLPAAAASVKVDIRNGNGTIVRTLELGVRAAGPSLFEWDGKTDEGAIAAGGVYTFSARAVSGGAETAAGTLMAARVDGVRNDSGAVQLMLKGVGSVAYADIKHIL